MLYDDRMVSVDPSVLLARALVPTDLRSSGAALYRRLSKILGKKAQLGGDSFVRVPGAMPLIVVQIRRGENEIGGLYVLSGIRKRVQAILVPAVGCWGVHCGEWRRQNDQMVGTFYDEIGNRDAVGVAVFRHDAEGWRLVG